MSDSQVTVSPSPEPQPTRKSAPNRLNEPKIVILFLVVAVIALVAVIVALSPTARLHRQIKAGDAASVIAYVDEHLSDPVWNADGSPSRASENTRFALQEAIARNQTAVVDHFEQLAITGRADGPLRSQIFSTFASSKQPFHSLDTLIDLIVNSEPSQSTYAPMVEAAKVSQLELRLRSLARFMTPPVKDDLEQDTQGWLTRVLRAAGDVCPELQTKVASARESLGAAISFSNSMQAKTSELQKNEHEIREAEDALSRKPFPISGFIVGTAAIVGTAPDGYEITLGDGGNHAYLYTSSTNFQSRGAFSLVVKYYCSIPVQVKQEYGGFTQQWKVFTECDQKCLDGRKKVADDIENQQKQNAQLQKEIASTTVALVSSIKELGARLCDLSQTCVAKSQGITKADPNRPQPKVTRSFVVQGVKAGKDGPASKHGKSDSISLQKRQVASAPNSHGSGGGGVIAPKVIYKVEPEFSDEARKNKFQGVAVLRVIIGTDGRIHDVKVQRSLGMGLDEKAVEAARQWRFEPGQKDGKPVPVEVSMEVSFRLY